MNTTKKRNSSIESLKVLAVILIIFSSATPYGATYPGGFSTFVKLSTPTPTLQYMFFLFCRWCGQIGDTLFIACSAWFLCDSKHSRQDKILLMMVASWIYSMTGLVLALPWVHPSLKELIQSVFPITFKTNWFVGCYILYYAVHPFINKSLEGLSKVRLFHISLFLFIVYSVFAQFGQFYYYSELVAFISIHVIVTYFKKYHASEQTVGLNIRMILICLGLITLWIIGLSAIGSKIGFFQNRGLMFCHYYNPVIIILSLNAVCFASKKIWYSAFINFLSSKSLLIYLAHSSYFWLTYGKYYTFDVLASHGVAIIPSWLLLVLLYFPTTVVLAVIFDNTFGRLVPHIYKKIKVISDARS